MLLWVGIVGICVKVAVSGIVGVSGRVAVVVLSLSVLRLWWVVLWVLVLK